MIPYGQQTVDEAETNAIIEILELAQAAKRLNQRDHGLPVAEKVYNRMLTLPIFPTMADSEMATIVDGVANLMGSYEI